MFDNFDKWLKDEGLIIQVRSYDGHCYNFEQLVNQAIEPDDVKLFRHIGEDCTCQSSIRL